MRKIKKPFLTVTDIYEQYLRSTLIIQCLLVELLHKTFEDFFFQTKKFRKFQYASNCKEIFEVLFALIFLHFLEQLSVKKQVLFIG